jgi:hypothetical protein
MMHPAIHIVLTADEETVRLICATIAFLAICWCGIKFTCLLMEKE